MKALRENIGMMIQVGFRGLTLDTSNPVIRGIRKHKIGWIVLFDYDEETRSYNRNIASPSQLKELTGSLRRYCQHSICISVDQEGGVVNRLKPEYGFPETYSHRFLGLKDDPVFTYNHASLIARTLQEAGITVNLAPVLDLGINRQNPIIFGKERSFSHDPQVVTTHARQFIRAHQDVGILNAVKHFPGHGSSSTDTHAGFVDVTDTWSETELAPYHVLIQENLCHLIMTSHVFNRRLDSEFPATLSHRILTGLLRTRLRYNGLIMTDDLQMNAIRTFCPLEEAITCAINAGADIINIGNTLEYREFICDEIVEIITRSIEQGKVQKSRIQDAIGRIERIRHSVQPRL